MKRQLTLTFASLRISHLLILFVENRSVGIPKMSLPVPFFGLVSQAGEHAAQLCICSPLLFSDFCPGRVLDGSVPHSMDFRRQFPTSLPEMANFRVLGNLLRLRVCQADRGGTIC